jgi:hypothetical protein
MHRRKHGGSHEGQPIQQISPRPITIISNTSDLPDKRAKHNCCDPSLVEGALPAHPPLATPPTRHSHKGRKPKEHGESLDTSDRELVCCTREAGRCESEVGDGEEGPYGCEEHECNGGGSQVIFVDHYDVFSTGL